MCRQPCCLEAEEGQSEEGGDEGDAFQEMLGAGLWEKCDREEHHVSNLFVETP